MPGIKLTIDSTGSLAECTIEGRDGSNPDRFIVRGCPQGDAETTLQIACSCVVERLQNSPEASGTTISGPWTEDTGGAGIWSEEASK